MTGGRASAASWARREGRRRWRALLVLGLLAGVTAGLSASALSGARRADTAFDRFHDEARGAHAIVFATYGDVFDADWTPVLEDPVVEAGGTFSLAPVAFELPDGGEGPAFVLPPSQGLYVDTEAPIISDGRAPEPDRADEMWINQEAADEAGLAVGDTLTLVSYLDLAAFFGDVAGARPGPTFPVTVTGIGKVPTEFTWMPGAAGYVTRAVLDEHPEIPQATNLVVRLRDGAADLPRLRELVSQHVSPNVPILDLDEAGRRVETSTDVERNGLLLFGLAVGAAGLLIVGQAIVRSVQASAIDAPTLRALGFTRRELAGTLVLPLLPAAALAGLVSAGLTVALSPRYPIGLARQLEPDPGVRVEPGLMVALVVLTVLLVLAFAAVAAVRSVHRLDRPAPSGSGGVVAAGLQRLALPLPAAIGVRFALTSGGGRSSLPAGPAIFGSIVAVLGVVAAFTFATAIDDAIDDPSLVGSSWDATTYGAGEFVTITPEQEELIAGSPDVAEYALALSSVAVIDDEPTPLFSLDAQRGRWSYRLLDGRPPAADDEIALGPDTLDELGLEVGDGVTLGDGDAELEVVGTALLQQGVHWAYDQGVWMTPDGIRQAADAVGDEAELSAHLRWAEGADVDRATATFEEAGLLVEEPTLPQTLDNLRFVRPLPFLLAGFLLVLGVGAVGHSLVSAVRRRRHELAVLRTMGMTPRQAWASSAWQATALALVGVVVGVPLGLALGRVLWRWVAEAAPLYYVAPTAILVLVLALPITVLAANALAALPGRAAARLRPAHVLRTE
jgi:hypothetical protein